jgi:hypothetical protein
VNTVRGDEREREREVVKEVPKEQEQPIPVEVEPPKHLGLEIAAEQQRMAEFLDGTIQVLKENIETSYMDIQNRFPKYVNETKREKKIFVSTKIICMEESLTTLLILFFLFFCEETVWRGKDRNVWHKRWP